MAERPSLAWLENKAAGFLSLRRRLNARRQGPFTALDVDGLALRAVSAARRGSGAALTRLAVKLLDLPPKADRSDPAVMGRAIAQALDKLGLKSGPVAMGVPRASVLLRTLTLPVIADAGELASVVHLQIGKDLPFPTNEAVIDFKVRRQPVLSPPLPPEIKAGDTSPKEEASPPLLTPKLQVLVGVVKRDVVEPYQKIAAAAGLKLAALGLLPYGNARSVEACGSVGGAGGVAIITLRPDEVGIDIVVHNSLLFSRGAVFRPPPDVADLEELSLPPLPGTVAAPALPHENEAASTGTPVSPLSGQPDTFVEKVTIEIVRSLHSYGGMEPQHPVAEVVVVGATGQEAAVVEALRGALNIPCRELNPASELNLPEASREHAAGSFSAIGLALGANDPDGLPFDFLNPKRPAAPRNMRRILLGLGLVALTATVVLVVGLRSRLISQRETLKSHLRTELAEAKKKRPIYTQMRQQMSTVQDWMQGGHNWLEHYAYLTAVLPPSEELYVTSLSVSSQGTIHLSVQAQSGEILAKLDKQLRAAGYEVKPLAINPGSDKFGYDFRSTVELSVPAKMKFDLSKVHPLPRPADDLPPGAAPKKGAAR